MQFYIFVVLCSLYIVADTQKTQIESLEYTLIIYATIFLPEIKSLKIRIGLRKGLKDNI